MIESKRDLNFYIMADRIMNGYLPQKNMISRIKETMMIGGAKVIIIKYLYHLRRYAYFYNNHNLSFCHKLMMVYEHYMLAKYAIKTGFSIG